MYECCPQCGGEPTFLGTLLGLDHLRCRNCGWDWAVESEPDEDDEPEDDGQPSEWQEWHDFDPDC